MRQLVTIKTMSEQHSKKGIDPNDDHGFDMQNILTQHLKCLREIQKLSVDIKGIKKVLERIFIAIIVCFVFAVNFWRLTNDL